MNTRVRADLDDLSREPREPTDSQTHTGKRKCKGLSNVSTKHFVNATANTRMQVFTIAVVG